MSIPYQMYISLSNNKLPQITQLICLTNIYTQFGKYSTKLLIILVSHSVNQTHTSNIKVSENFILVIMHDH